MGKKVAVMQPYFLPYVGYWQLIEIVDVFVIFDDVNFINRGFIDSNTILLGGRRHKIKLELRGASQNKLINEIAIGKNLAKLRKTIEHAYKKARFFDQFFPLLSECLEQEQQNLAVFLEFTIRKISNYLKISTEIVRSSDYSLNAKGKEKIIPLVKSLNGKAYVNPVGGRSLYSEEEFEKERIRLIYFEPKIRTYPQLSPSFEPCLSAVDFLMNVSPGSAKKLIRSDETPKL